MSNEKKNINIKRAVIFGSIAAFFIATILLMYSAFAEVKEVRLFEEKGTGREYLYFEIDHIFSNAKYKYYGYGYTVSIYDKSRNQFLDLKGGRKQVFISNKDFGSSFDGNIEKVKIYIDKLFEKTGVEAEYFFSNSLTVYLNGRIGIKVDEKGDAKNWRLVHLYDSLEGDVVLGMPEGHEIGSYTTLEDGTAPLNGDGLGIKNALPYYYGISWSTGTQSNLAQNFNIKYDVKASALYDGLFVEYKYNGERIGYDPIRQFDKEHKNLEIDINMPSGFLYNGKYEKGVFYNRSMVSGEGDNITVDIKKATDSYTSKCHHIVIECEKLPSTGTPVSVDVEYRLNSKTGEKVSNSKTVTGYVNTLFNLSSERLDDYICKKYIVIGQTEKEIEGTSASFKMNSESWSTLLNGKLKIIFIYEERPVVIIPKCEPRFDGLIGSTTITMKRSVFDSLEKISVQNATFGIENLTVGQDKDRNPVEGEHKFDTFDFYVYVNGKGNSPFEAKWDNIGHNANLSFDVSKTMFAKISDTTYRANIDVDYVTFCSCKGAGFCLWTWHEVIVNIIENKPPKALYYPVTRVEQANGDIRIIDDVYINHEATILNEASDPNGYEDIDYINYSFVSEKMDRFYLKMTKDKGNGIFYVDENTLEDAGIQFLGITETGNVRLIFKTGETWTVNQLVADIEGLQDIYTNTITPVELNLQPIAKITDVYAYRFPTGIAFSGKQNRTIGLSGSTSRVAGFLQGTDTYIDHEKDCVEIIPLESQNINNVYFENNIEYVIEDNILKLTDVNFLVQNLMFKEMGKYMVRLQVTDTKGNISEWAEQIIYIVEDSAPVIDFNLDSKYFRNSGTKMANIQFYVEAFSSDNDFADISEIKYKFDSNNDGYFEDETYKTENLTVSEITIDGVKHKQVTLKSFDVGKYQFYVTAKDTFGQDTIYKYINSEDYKTGSLSKIAEIDNYAPVGQLSLSNITKKNIDIKILTGDLSGTRSTDLINNTSTLKQSLEADGKLNANIELINTAKTIDINNKALTWRKVVMEGKFSTGLKNNFWFRDIKDTHTNPNDPIVGTRVEALPAGIYATGWNGIPISDMHLYKNYNGTLTHNMIDRPFWVTDYVYWIYAGSNTHTLTSYNNGKTVSIGSLTGESNWALNGSANVEGFQAVSEQKLSDFDISFSINHQLVWDWEGTSPNEYLKYFLFNVKDENNYYLYYIYYPRNHNSAGYYLHTKYGLEEPFGDNLVEGIVQIKNGKMKIIKQFHSRYDLGETYEDDDRVRTIRHAYSVSRLKQTDKTLEVYAKYDYYEKKIATIQLDDNNLGGYIGVGGIGLVLKNINLNINNLTFIENGSMTEVLNNADWKENSDKYVINIQENNKLDELKNTDSLNKVIGVLQAKDINLINIGVNSINGTKLKQMISKNLNNGIYIELGNISSNLSSASNYIKNKYTDLNEEALYILLNDNLKYSEIYSDAENDNKFDSRYKFNHTANYFENNLGTINNNNHWQDKGIEIFNKVGKFVLQYQVQDNPLKDSLLTNPFSDYRKYSNIYQKEIYVHRKPVAKFIIDSSFKNNALLKKTTIEDFEDTNLENFNIIATKRNSTNYESGETSYTIPSNSYVYSGKANTFSNRHTSDWYIYSLEDISFDVSVNNNMIEPIVSFDYYISMNNTEYSVSGVFITITDKDTGSLVLQKNIATKSDGYYNENGTYTYEIPKNLKNIKINISSSLASGASCSIAIDNIKLTYHEKNLNVQVPLTESSYDLDHQSLVNKGIIEWEWKVIKKDGSVYKQNFTDKNTGINWVKTQLAGTGWEDSTVVLKVKDMEGFWSDNADYYIDEDIISNPGEQLYKKPIAAFELIKNPVILNAEMQTIINNSYDLQGLPLTYHWDIFKDNVHIDNYIGNDINTKINNFIHDKGIGNYRIELVAYNSKNLFSNTAVRDFDVIRLNTAPIIDFKLISNENPAWIFPKAVGTNTYLFRNINTLFIEEKSKFNVDITDVDADNLGFIYSWKFERYDIKDMSEIKGMAKNVYTYNTKYPFVDSFKSMFLPWGAYRITLSVTDMPPIPPYQIGSEKTISLAKTYYIIPEISLLGSYEGKSEIVVGDNIELTAKTNKEVTSVYAKFNGDLIELLKVSEDSQYAYWEKNNYSIPESIVESGTYYIDFTAYTNYGGNGNNTRKTEYKVPINITALKLLNFRITNIINHTDVLYPYTKEMLINKLIDYKTGYYVTFLIDSKGKPDSVDSKILIDGILNQNITLEKITSGDTDVWQGKFYTNARLPEEKIISIMTSCSKGTIIYDYNLKENWDGKSLIIKGSALQDGRINLTN